MILSGDGSQAEIGQTGLIAIDSPHVCTGYLNRPTSMPRRSPTSPAVPAGGGTEAPTWVSLTRRATSISSAAPVRASN